MNRSNRITRSSSGLLNQSLPNKQDKSPLLIKNNKKIKTKNKTTNKDTNNKLINPISLDISTPLQTKNEISSIYFPKKKKKRTEIIDSTSTLDVNKKIKNLLIKAPEKWKEIYDNIKIMRTIRDAKVDTDGCETFYDNEAEPLHIRRFHVLISAMLSSQTKDTVNSAAMKRLKEYGLTVDSMLRIDEKTLSDLIYPVSFFHRKVKYIKETCAILKEKSEKDGLKIHDIPKTFEEIVKLPGVGPKMAHLVMTCAWQNTVGICVDVHVHRIANRLGWVKTWNNLKRKSQDPEKTRKELEEWLPIEYWTEINPLLVGFGQQICLPLRPKCKDCKVSSICPSAFKKDMT